MTDQATIDHSDQIMVNEMRSQLWTDMVGLTILYAVTAYTVIAFAPYVPPVLLYAWAGTFTVILSTWFAAVIYRNIRPMPDQQFLDRWHGFDLLGAVLVHVWIAASVWILLPHAPVGLFYGHLVLYAWYILSFTLIATEAVRKVRNTLFLVVGSVVVYLLVNPVPGGWVIAAAILLMGLTATLLQALVRAAVIKETTSRLAVEAARHDLERVLVEVSAQRDARSRFMAVASHDLQQPIQAASLLFDVACETSGPVDRKVVKTGQAAFASVTALLDDMLGFMRLSAQGLQSRPVEQSLGALLNEVTDRYRLRELGGIKLRLVDSSLRLVTDHQLFCRALGNLIENAVRHSQGRRVLIGVRRCNSAVRIWVIDDGIGIPPAARGSIFDAYVQGSGQDREVNGFGLGLPSAALIASHLGGRLFLADKRAAGAAFCLELPYPGTRQDQSGPTDAKDAACTAA